jgi:HSF-type DNA-binding
MGEKLIAPSPVASSSSSHDGSKESGSSKCKEVRQPFPWKVYEMLEDADSLGFDDIVSWNERGDGFKVHDVKRFTNEIIGKYFNQSKYKSFQRQLSLYGFERCTEGQNKGLRYHEKLRKSNKTLCRQMKPVGYKPRGQEKISEQKEQQPTSDKSTQGNSGYASPITVPITAGNHGLPSVVSSESIHQAIPVSPCPDTANDDFIMTTALGCSSPPSITERLVTTDNIAVFEGMPFYLMTTLPPDTNHSASYLRPISQHPPSGDERDGQIMKKAWDIGFAVASSLPTTVSPGVVPGDTLGTAMTALRG